MALKSAVNFDKGIANDNFKRDKKNKSHKWKWMIVAAYGLANVLIIPVITSFGLIFKDKFRILNLSTLEATLILNLNSALGMLLGLFNGALLKMFGYRVIAVIGGIFFSGGIISTAFAESFQHFLITYSIITSIGMGLCTSAFSLALNTYFKEDRNKAFGLGATITGLGPILLPHLITLLLKSYGTQGCVLIIGGLSMNIIVAALLLKPLKPEENQPSSIEESSLYKPTPSISIRNEPNSDDDDEYIETCPIYHDVDTQSIYGVDVYLHPLTKSDEILWKDLDYKFTPKVVDIRKTKSENNINREPSIEVIVSGEENEDFYPANTRRWFEGESVESVNLESSVNIFHEEEKVKKNLSILKLFDEHSFLGRRASMIKLSLMHRRNTVAVIHEEEIPKNFDRNHRKSISPTLPIPPPYLKIKKTSRCSKFFKPIRNGWRRFVKVFDLGLLTDKIYLNLVIGIAIAIFAEINFSLLTPFILNEFNYTTEQIAMFMSILASVDIISRFSSPLIGDRLKQPARIMYMYALFMLIIMRTSLLFTNDYNGIIIVAIGMGLAKGVRQVYMSCIVSSYIPLERLPAASGIQMVANGIVLLSMGSSIGVFHDLFGSYAICVVFINLMTFITLCLWITEMVYMKRKSSRVMKEIEEQKVPELCKLNIEVN